MPCLVARIVPGHRLALVACCLLLVACGHRNGAAGSDGNPQATDSISLPKPAVVAGSVTGMPDRPGPGNVGLPAAVATASTVVAPAESNVDDAHPETDVTDSTTPAAESAPAIDAPDQADAVAVIRDYYASIDNNNYAHAWSLWSDGGHASGQTLQQFADGFANTAQVTLEAGAPGPMDAAAGSRFVQVPVTIEATARDGSVQHYVGTYVLRRSVVDGATSEQRAWRIASATMHVVTN
jgi:hypothetical protein